MTTGYVYLIYDKGNDVYKIGVTRDSSERRIKKLQTGNCTELKIIYLIQTEFPFRLESMLHNHFKEQQVLNEWYDLTREQVGDFENLVNKMINIINGLKNNPFFTKHGLK